MFKNFKARAAAIMLAVSAMTFLPASANAATTSERPAVTYTQIDGTMLYASPESLSDCTTQIAEYQAVPFGILKELVSMNCRIYLFTTNENGGFIYDAGVGDATGEYYAGAYMVAKTTPAKIVSCVNPAYIEILSDYDASANQTTVLHEIGHFVDSRALGGWENAGCNVNVASSTKEWTDIVAKDGKALGKLSDVAAIITDSPSQMFAEVFAHYIKNPERVKKISPSAYTYMESIVTTFQ